MRTIPDYFLTSDALLGWEAILKFSIEKLSFYSTFIMASEVHSNSKISQSFAKRRNKISKSFKDSQLHHLNPGIGHIECLEFIISNDDVFFDARDFLVFVDDVARKCF